MSFIGNPIILASLVEQASLPVHYYLIVILIARIEIIRVKVHLYFFVPCPYKEYVWIPTCVGMNSLQLTGGTYT